MVSQNKSNVMAAVAGVVVGAGAAIAGAAVLADKKNQQKLNRVIEKGQTMAKNYVRDVNEKTEKLVKVAKTAEKGVKNI